MPSKSGVAPGDNLEDVVGDLPRADQHQRHPVARPARRPAEPEAVHRGVLGPGPEQRQLIQAVGQAEHGTSPQVVPAKGAGGDFGIGLFRVGIACA